MSEPNLEQCLQRIRDEANIRDASETEWIVDEYNHMFGTNYETSDFNGD